MPSDFKPVVGHRFTFHTRPIASVGYDGIIPCEVLELDEERLLRIGWGGGALNTTVTWRLVAEGRGTRLFIEHAGFAMIPLQASAFQGMGSGWRSHVMRSLIKVLASPRTSVVIMHLFPRRSAQPPCSASPEEPLVNNCMITAENPPP
ncbi:SRPBCC family protein [Actinomadura alba]|uniref:SRPBCC family protein n=1 Tax=Actinomadura alba TaxID=406431 RepID=UPI001C9C01F6|nr:SRPBCC domain-containing protein [Actinomadura alba]